MTEDNFEEQAKRLYPHIRDIAHTEDELATHARKLYPHIQDSFHQDVGKNVLITTAGMLRKALWAVGGAIVALLSFKWMGR